ncbi:MAG: phytoene/squalene synthase family protein [Chitinophagaceae bacterium]
MKKLFDELSREVSKVTTKKYSTSFSLGILALNPSIRPAIYAIYGYVRLADEIVDSFHDYDKQVLLQRLKQETDNALAEGVSLNPILQSFQETVSKYHIDRALIDQFLKSMEMDLHNTLYDTEKYNEYILGSAEVVGLMCLQIFVGGDNESYATLKPYAMKLGSAFQKVNFLRDLKDDYTILNRTYFPNIDLRAFDNIAKLQIEKEIATEFEQSLIGIKKLPASARFGVYLAYRYYYSLFKKIRKFSADKLLQERVRIKNAKKLTLMVYSYLRFKITAI